MAELRALTPVQIEAVKVMLKSNMTWKGIGDCFNVCPETVRRAVDPEYREKRAKQVAARRAAGPAPVNPKQATRAYVANDAAIRVAEIPHDTRSLTARMFGDPLPGRSALDRRSA